MTRTHAQREEYENSNEAFQDNHTEGSCARTRPFSYDEIVLRRKNKGDVAKQDVDGPGVPDIELGSDNNERSSHFSNSDRHLKEDSKPRDTRHTSNDSQQASSRKKGNTNVSSKNEILVQDKNKGSQGAGTRLKSTVEKNVSSYRDVGGKDEDHHHRNKKKDALFSDDFDGKYENSYNRNRKKDAFLSDDFDNGSDKRRAKDLVKKDRDSENIRGKSRKDEKQVDNEKIRGQSRKDEKQVDKEKIRGQSRKDEKQVDDEDRHGYRKRKTDEGMDSDSEKDPKRRNARDVMQSDRYTDRSRDKSEKEHKHKRHIEEEERNRGRSSGKRHDTEKRGQDTIQSNLDESRSKRRRSRSREREKDKGRRSVSHSPKAHKHTLKDKRDHGELSSQFAKEGSEREHSNVDKKRISSNGSSDHYKRNANTSSRLGGYSPRKRKTEAAAKTPSPTRRSPERRTAGWDLPPVGKESVIDGSTPSNLTVSSQNLFTNIKEFPSNIPMAPTMVKPVKISPLTLSSQMHAVESIQLTQATRPMRRLYIENLPPTVSDKDLMECINKFLLSSGVNHIQGTQPCISCIIHKEKGQALLEFLTPEDASVALSLDGISFAGSDLKFRRPKDYTEVTTGVPEKSLVAVDSISDTVEDSPHKIFLGGVSKVISSEMLLEIAKAFGAVKAYHFDFTAGISEPCAFLEYVDHSVSPKACAGLNGMRLGGQVLTAVFATPDSTLVENARKPPFYGIPEHAKPLLEMPTAILKLKNVLDPEGLSSLSELELEEILEDIKLECSRFGTVKSINVAKAHEAKGASASSDGCNLELRNECNIGEQLGEIINETGQPDEPEPPAALDERVNKIKIAEDDEDDKNKKDASMRRSGSANSHDELTAENLMKGEICEPSCDIGTSCDIGNTLVEEPINDDRSDSDPVGTTEMENKPMMEDQLKLEEENNNNNINNTEKVGPAELCSDDREEVAAPPEEDGKNDIPSADYGDIFEPASVFVEYRRPEAACTAAHSLHGRTFDGRIVTVGYVDQDLYHTRFRR